MRVCRAQRRYQHKPEWDFRRFLVAMRLPKLDMAGDQMI
jgi:hypothetical protein